MSAPSLSNVAIALVMGANKASGESPEAAEEELACCCSVCVIADPIALSTSSGGCSTMQSRLLLTRRSRWGVSGDAGGGPSISAALGSNAGLTEPFEPTLDVRRGILG
eukprot:7165474-Prymnesium_polylepis.1